MKFGTAPLSEYLVKRATGLRTYDRVNRPGRTQPHNIQHNNIQHTFNMGF
jgi:hypothetical protein